MRRLLPLLLAAGVAGCGGGAPRTTTEAAPKLPRALAQAWASRADEVAGAVDAGDGCRAQQLAASLRNDVISQQARLPARLRSSLLTSVNRLANEIACTPPTVTVTKPAPPGPKKPPGREKGHGHGHGHGKPHGKGDDR
ncbi:MAG TPA: hypothetical protein VFJ77_06650 [Gaiellaceae bacterium]|nr:hypothetical protein [Gaiellaceae bacterium]